MHRFRKLKIFLQRLLNRGGITKNSQTDLVKLFPNPYKPTFRGFADVNFENTSVLCSRAVSEMKDLRLGMPHYYYFVDWRMNYYQLKQFLNLPGGDIGIDKALLKEFWDAEEFSSDVVSQAVDKLTEDDISYPLVKKSISKIYFSTINACEITCSNCGQVTELQGRFRVRFTDDPNEELHGVGNRFQYQCQDCGRFKTFGMSAPNYFGFAEERCECGGEFRRDNPIFCNNCFYNQLSSPRSNALPVYSGFKELDEITGGFQKQGLYIIASKPDVGKTTFLISLINNFISAATPIPSILFSLHNNAEQLTKRIVFSVNVGEPNKLNQYHYNGDELQDFYEISNNIFNKGNVKIIYDPSLTIRLLRDKLVEATQDGSGKNVQVVFIDCIQIMFAETGVYSDEVIEDIMIALKLLAKEFNILVILTTRLSNASDLRESKMPRLSDLHNAKPICSYSDAILFIIRPEFYEMDNGTEIMTTTNERHIVVAKNSFGKLGIAKFIVNSAIQRFSDVIDHDLM